VKKLPKTGGDRSEQRFFRLQTGFCLKKLEKLWITGGAVSASIVGKFKLR
jgi:hypothetical protein